MATELDVVRNLARVQQIVRRSENPHPCVVAIIILISLLLMYYIYVNSIKPSLSGIWINSDKTEYHIKHNKFKDTIEINKTYPGFINGTVLVVYMGDILQMGIFTNDKIKWLNGEVWYSAIGV